MPDPTAETAPEPPIRARRRVRREINAYTPPEARVNYVYRLYDENGDALYIGRSVRPLERLKSHHASGAEWATRVVGIDAWGPFDWPTVLRLERDAITAERPPGNKEFVINKFRRPPEMTPPSALRRQPATGAPHERDLVVGDWKTCVCGRVFKSPRGLHSHVTKANAADRAAGSRTRPGNRRG